MTGISPSKGKEASADVFHAHIRMHIASLKCKPEDFTQASIKEEKQGFSWKALSFGIGTQQWYGIKIHIIPDTTMVQD